MSETQEKFEGWAVVEIMGHQKFAGYISEQVVAGAALVRVDVPEVPDHDDKMIPAFTKMFGPGSIYCLTPVSEEVAKVAAARVQARPLNIYMPELYPTNPTKLIAAGVQSDDRDLFGDRDEDEDL